MEISAGKMPALRGSKPNLPSRRHLARPVSAPYFPKVVYALALNPTYEAFVPIESPKLIKQTADRTIFVNPPDRLTEDISHR